MVRLIFRLLFWLKGWKVKVHPGVDVNKLKKSVILAAPHTSNWDFVFSVAGCRQMGVKLRFAIKQSWMKFPLNIAIRPMGGIAVDRSDASKRKNKTALVDAMADLYKERDELCIMIAPEGTRSLTKSWKKGFYYTAQRAEVPIALAYLDYKNKVAGIGKVIYPSGDMDKDMVEIMKFYQHITPKNPELFALDRRYAKELAK
ncbi:1-acyl-sn-glycerol-3-phosphate acyltransferase [Limibacter armeniacum]|uniref:1-acyl-sn-glycerol-3-phosphate acyltransferase n=1 Tax=Limibacter armeniacum TaxID=466084 RepID=UPI002FE6523C